jgi:hypothetical protein
MFLNIFLSKIIKNHEKSSLLQVPSFQYVSHFWDFLRTTGHPLRLWSEAPQKDLNLGMKILGFHDQKYPTRPGKQSQKNMDNHHITMLLMGGTPQKITIFNSYV